MSATDELGRARDGLGAVREQLKRVIVGCDDVIDELLVALLADGHVLLEGAPGLGKTLLVRSLAGALSLSFGRVQCTPDLMPGDVTGSEILRHGEDGARFDFVPGPVFTNVLLVDEINRATPKTQSSLLEAMEERQVSAGGQTRPLPTPFVVLATQNPIEMEGTYPLPEAQLDRFLLKVLIGAPDVDALAEIVRRGTGVEEERVDPVLNARALTSARELTRSIAIAPAVLRSLVEAVAATRPDGPDVPSSVKRYVRYGASPRGARSLALAAKGRAVLDGRPNVALDDVRAMLAPALRHRLLLNFEADADGVTADDVLADVAARLA